MFLLSVVIPTKNRYYYLKNFIKSFSENSNKEIELIIHDNSDLQSSDFIDYLYSLNDSRIVYKYIHGWISVVDNCDLAVDLARGEYVCMLGDDDGILYDTSISLINYAKKNGISAIVVNKASYYWPDTKHDVWKNLLSSKLFYGNYSFQVKKIDTKNELLKVLKRGAAVSLFSLPRVYHGFVQNAALKILKQTTGSFFPGPSPDMSNAIGLATILQDHVKVDVPAIISGHSRKSTGGLGGEKKHHGRIENQKFLPKETLNNWSRMIPEFWSGPTIYAESAKEALKRTNNSYISKINYPYLWAFCFIFERSYSKEIYRVTSKNLNQIHKLIYYIICIIIFRTINYIKNNFKYKYFKSKYFISSDMYNAQKYLSKYVYKKEIVDVS